MQVSPLLFMTLIYAKCCKDIKCNCVRRSLVKQEIEVKTGTVFVSDKPASRSKLIVEG